VSHPVFQPVDTSWLPLLEPLREEIISVCELVTKAEYIPAMDRILAPLSTPLDDVRVVIVGQDPYPNAEYADGFAF